jgi:peptide-methionine (R)-S-oxide reductase
MLTRRQALCTLVALPALARTAAARAEYAAGTSKQGVEMLQMQWRKYLARNADVATDATPLKLADDAWQKRLAPDAYRVLRHQGTELPGSSPLLGEKRDGVFVCAGCALPAYTSAMKFDSGTGWPSFVTSVPGSLEMGRGTKSVFVGLEVHCAKCGGHHGHVFDDGPQPLGDRWCINGVALRFIPLA